MSKIAGGHVQKGEAQLEGLYNKLCDIGLDWEWYEFQEYAKKAEEGKAILTAWYMLRQLFPTDVGLSLRYDIGNAEVDLGHCCVILHDFLGMPNSLVSALVLGHGPDEFSALQDALCRAIKRGENLRSFATDCVVKAAKEKRTQYSSLKDVPKL